MDFPTYIPEGIRRAASTRWKQASISTAARKCIKSLISDPRMRQVYDRLSFRPELQGHYAALYWGNFFRAACDANQQFLRLREELEVAGQLIKTVSVLSLDLSMTLKQLEILNTYLPIEMTSALHLLSNSKGKQPKKWEKWKRILLIEPTKMQEKVLRSYLRPSDQGGKGTLTATDFRRRRPGQVHLDYSPVISDFAPHVVDLIQRLRLVSQSFRPLPRDDRLAAAMSRKRSERAEYVRLFATFLKENGFPIDSEMYGIIADTATVVLNLDPESILTRDYVRNVLKRLRK